MVHPKNKQDLLQIPAYPILSLFSQYVTTPWSSPPKKWHPPSKAEQTPPKQPPAASTQTNPQSFPRKRLGVPSGQ